MPRTTIIVSEPFRNVQISGNGYSIFISNQLTYDIIIIITINNLVEKTKTHIFINKYNF
jgi:hypothetical protein